MNVREKLEVIAHLGNHISYKEDIGICYDSELAKVIEDAYMALKNGVTVNGEKYKEIDKFIESRVLDGKEYPTEKLYYEDYQKELERLYNGVTVQSEIDANTFQIMRECEKLKEENESLVNAVNALEEINSELIKQIKAETVQKWISVKDRLPEEEGLYLVAVVNDHERRYSKTAWYHGHGNWFLHQKVTHWSYLPKPPKGE